jgi:hypothetical protein
MVQQNNLLLKRIYNLKLGKKDQRDPTVVNQMKKQTQDEIDRMGVGSKDKSKTTAHVEWLRKCPYIASCIDQVCLEGPNIMVPMVDNPLRAPELTNAGELKVLMTTPNGKLVDTPDITVQYKSEYQGHLGKLALLFESPHGL